MIKVIVAGTRKFNNNTFIGEKLDLLFSNFKKEDIEIVSGRCPTGPDKIGEDYAKANNIKLKLFPAKWGEFGLAAGPIRNKEMAEYATHCVVFWDGVSKGAKSMISLALEYKLKLRVVYI